MEKTKVYQFHVTSADGDFKPYRILPAFANFLSSVETSVNFLTEVSVISYVLGIWLLAKALLILTIFSPKVFVFQLD